MLYICNIIMLLFVTNVVKKMKTKIIEIFSCLKSDRRDNVRIEIRNKYKKSVDTIKVHWLFKGDVPAQYQDGVLKILEKELQKQISEDKRMLAK